MQCKIVADDSTVLCPQYAGGGNGWGVRHLGSAADNVIEFEVVVPVAGKAGHGSDHLDFELRRVNAESDPDLFWGLKGAGGFPNCVNLRHVHGIQRVDIYKGVNCRLLSMQECSSELSPSLF